MWGRINPLVVLLIFANTIFKVSCKGKGSLTFLIDDTSSMGDDIDQVRKSVDKITRIVKHEKSSLIDNMVLVTFNDPGVYDRVVTRDPKEFKKALGRVTPHIENPTQLDCWEPSMKGLLQALDRSNNDSYIFVFTDAPAKDYIDSRYVIEMCQKKQTQIVFVLTGRFCRKFPYVPEARNVFFDIAVACSGLAIFVNKNEVEKVFGPIEEIIKGNKNVITTATIPAGVSKNIPHLLLNLDVLQEMLNEEPIAAFVIDDYTDYVIVSAAGKGVTLKINDPSITVNKIMSTDNAIVVKLSNTKPGTFEATVKGKTNTSVVISGRTDFFFSHGFSEFRPKSLSDTMPQPQSDAKGYLSISVTDDNHSVRIESAKILNMDGKPIIEKLPLTEISENFYITDPFVAPSQRFKVAVEGFVKATNKPIHRTAKIPVSPPPKIAPKVLQGVTDMKVTKGKTAVFECKVVSGFPAANITWLFWGKSGSKFTPIVGSESVLRITNVEDKHGGKYKCVAKNAAGKDDHVTTLSVQDPPKIVSSISYIYESTEGDALLRIPCVAAGLPKPSIIWKLNGLVIKPSAKYSIENGTLIIRDPKVSDTNSYTCEAKNEVGAVSATFRTEINQAPQVSGVTYKKVRVGTPTTIECTVIKGQPKPTITWRFIDNSGSDLPILGLDKMLHISRVENKHAGRYKCVAKNKVGSNEHITTLEVQDLPKIVSSVSNIYESNEGDALLRIPCVATGLPKPSITWKLKGLAIKPSARYAIENGTLIIRDPKVSDTNSYTCEAKNEVGAVSATFRTNINQTPQVSGVTNKKVRVGTPATIECTVIKGQPKPTITWRFIDNSGSDLPILGLDKMLHISRVENKHAGRYKCVAKNKVGSNEHITTLEVQDLPKIVSSVSNIYESNEGDALLRIPCVATGLPKPSITWKLNGLVVKPNARYSIENGTLIIRDPKVSDTNWYTCEAKNEVGAVSATLRTNINQAPQVLGVPNKKVRLGTPTTIECTVIKGEPKPTITWRFMDNSGSDLPINGSDKVLHISSVQNKHAGHYKCVANNKVGSNEHIVTLEVQDLPKIVSSVSNIYESNEGDALLRIPCVATGLPKPSITWKLNGLVVKLSARYSIENGTLIIRDPKVSDTNSYTCEAKNEVGAVSATLRTNINQAPQVSGVTNKKVRVGTPATIECTVIKGEPKPTITWRFMDNSGSDLPINGSDKVLHISSVQNKHAGRYKCVANNKVGSNEHITTLEVQDLPKIVSSVSNIYESNEGDALLRIPCVATGLPKPSITWKLNGLVVKPSARYSIENGTLIIRDPKVSDTNSYTCEAKNEVGAVSATLRTNINQAPQVSGVTNKKVRVGTPATIECTVIKGEPKPTITWRFMDNSGSDLPINGSDKVLHISSVQNKHAGRYKCVANNKVGSNEHITTLEVQDLPKIVSSVSNIYESNEGDALLRIPCVATGLPKPSITWKLNGLVVKPSARYSIENGTLIIRDPKVSDTNSYTCEAKNEVGAVSATLRTNINQAPQVSGVTNKKVRVGTPATIECTVIKGEPKPTITWRFMDNSGSDLPINGSDKVLHISSVQNKHAGRYKCVANNKVGSNEHITTLEVQDLPKIVSSVSNIYESNEGDALLRIPCVATGLPKPSITWKLNGLVVKPSARYSIENGTLIIRDPKVSDTNSYTCEAKNEVGAVSATLRTNINQAPQVSGVTNKKVRVGTPATIECTVIKGEPKPTITWRFMDNSGSDLPINGSDKVLHISSVQNKHAGRYKCVANNKVGSNEHITTLEVQDLPKIVSSVSNIYESNEGDALLRIPCVATGLPKPSITWKLNGLVVKPSARYSIENGTLIIRYPKVSDTNSYTCEAKNEVGAVSATLRTNINQAPQVSGVNNKKVRVGTPATIECTVIKGEPKPTITWRFMDNSGSDLPINGSDKVLHISSVQNKHAGRYKCVANNKVGSNEHITTLEVQDLPKIVSSVSNIYESNEGDALLRIPCVATGLPKPSITWKLNGLVVKPSARYSIENGTLIIRDPKVSDTNSYTCEAKNEVGAVSATLRTNINQAPQVSGVTNKKVRVGTPATIECTVIKGEPKPTITWRFMDNSGSDLPINGSDKVLHISSVQNKHAGRYKCVANNKVGSNEHITTLEVQDLPKIVSSVSNIYESNEGDALLRIPCVATGLPKPSITWKLNGLVVKPSARYSIENGTLIIRYPKVSDTNSYTCEAKNEVGAVSATLRTNINQAPQVSGVNNKKVRVGTPATIECTVIKGEPKPTITWRFMDNSGSDLPINGSDKVLHISSVQNKHAGCYKCVANNKVGSNEHITTLEVQDLPKIVSSVSNIYESNEGDALLRIPCVATGLPKPSITWKLNGLVVKLNARYSIEYGTLIIRDPKVSDTNSYTCEAKNEVGAVSATLRTNINQAPQVSGVTNKKVRVGTPATIECTVIKGEPKPTITWRFMDNFGSDLPIPGSDKLLHISRVENKHAGRYKCVANNKVGSNEHITTLEVQDLPKIVSSVSNIESNEGDALLRIPCVATGLPKPSITWKLNGLVVKPSARYSIENGTLIIRNPKVSDTNSYTCEAKNEVGAVSATLRTNINQVPQVSGVTNKKVRIGTPATIECTVVKGEPKPTITWRFMDNSGSDLPIPGSDKVLHITRVENKHAGRYKCVAKNKVGSDEHVTTLIVESLPGITTKSTTVEGIEGDLALRIPCDVVGIPKPVITWKINGTKITPDGKYLIEDGALVIVKPSLNDPSSFTCEAKNSVGSVSTMFQAAVEKYPKTFGTEHYVYLLENETRKLKCEAYSSKSQSVIWFKALANSLSPDFTTTSPLDFESSETTTMSSKDYSSTPAPIITEDAGITEPYIQIAKASSTDHDGNYTCRVSDKHGNTHTHTYVVDVGNAPQFLFDDNNDISDWRGDISHIQQYCDVQDDLKPKPMVEWKFNGEVLTDFNLAGAGHYTCNVSNVHGSVHKGFHVKSSVCLITRNLRDAQYMPLVLNDKGFWHKLETTNHYTIVEQEVKIRLSCPSQKETSNTFKKFPKKSTLEAFCNKNDSSYYVVENKNYKFSDLQCTNSIQPSVIRKKVKCSTETSELMRVGYNVPGFLEAYEVCFDTEQNMPIYTRIIMTETNNNGLSAGYNWYTYPGIGNKKTEKGFTCKDTMSSCCYSKSQLVNAIDFNDGPAKRSSFIDPLNVIPVWLPCNTSRPTWETVNDNVRSLLPTFKEIITWSGTHTFQAINGAIIPRYLWKVVWHNDEEKFAIIHVNDPSRTEKDIKCKDICSKYEWIQLNDKYTYCCSLSDFFEAFNIHNIDIGESLHAALDEMKKKSD